MPFCGKKAAQFFAYQAKRRRHSCDCCIASDVHFLVGVASFMSGRAL